MSRLSRRWKLNNWYSSTSPIAVQPPFAEGFKLAADFDAQQYRIGLASGSDPVALGMTYTRSGAVVVFDEANSSLHRFASNVPAVVPSGYFSVPQTTSLSTNNTGNEGVAGVTKQAGQSWLGGDDAVLYTVDALGSVVYLGSINPSVASTTYALAVYLEYTGGVKKVKVGLVSGLEADLAEGASTSINLETGVIVSTQTTDATRHELIDLGNQRYIYRITFDTAATVTGDGFVTGNGLTFGIRAQDDDATAHFHTNSTALIGKDFKSAGFTLLQQAYLPDILIPANGSQPTVGASKATFYLAEVIADEEYIMFAEFIMPDTADRRHIFEPSDGTTGNGFLIRTESNNTIQVSPFSGAVRGGTITTAAVATGDKVQLIIHRTGGDFRVATTRNGGAFQLEGTLTDPHPIGMDRIAVGWGLHFAQQTRSPIIKAGYIKAAFATDQDIIDAINNWQAPA